MSDSLTEKLTPAVGNSQIVKMFLDDVHRAGLVLFDPADPAVIDRVATALYYRDSNMQGRIGPAWKNASDETQAEYREDACAVLAALGGDR